MSDPPAQSRQGEKRDQGETGEQEDEPRAKNRRLDDLAMSDFPAVPERDVGAEEETKGSTPLIDH